MDLLDDVLDSLADLPTNKPYPIGTHQVIFNFTEKVINNKPAVQLKMQGVATVELADPSKDAPIEPGQETQLLFILKNNDGTNNEISQGQIKNILKPLLEVGAIQGDTTRELLKACNGLEVLVTTGLRQNKETKEFNTIIKNVAAI